MNRNPACGCECHRAEPLREMLADLAQWLHRLQHIFVDGVSPARFEACSVMPCCAVRAMLEVRGK